VLDPRHDDRGRRSRAKPGQNRVLLCTAKNGRSADAIVRSLAVHELPCSARDVLTPFAGARTKGRDVQRNPVDLYVRGSDLERARRIVRKSVRV
jgi:hypothetical protein